MKIKTIAITAVSAVLMSGAANANILWDIYSGITIGAGGVSVYADHDTHSESAQSFGAIVGIDVPVLRFEAEYNYLRDGDLTLNTAAGNVYAKMPSTIVKPYIGAGVGVTFDGKIDNIQTSKFDNSILYQAMLGLTFDVPTLPINVDVEARTMYMPDLYTITDTTNGTDIKPDALHYDLRLKLRYVF